LVLFFRKEQDSSFSEEKEAKRLLCLGLFLDAPEAAPETVSGGFCWNHGIKLSWRRSAA
jgi:hypothetical protein